MEHFKITEEQEWQLFELLEGNLTPQDAQQLQQEIERNPALKAHYLEFQATYLQPSSVEFPNAQALKKSNKNKQVYFYFSLSAAAAIALLWVSNFLMPTTKSQGPTLEQTANIAKNSPQENLEFTPTVGYSIPVIKNTSRGKHSNQSASSSTSQAFNAAHSADQNTTQQRIESTTINNTQIHPLIVATEQNRSTPNVNDTAVRRNKIRTTPESQLANNATITTPKLPSQKNKRALIQSFYRDARAMVENGHVPHIKVKAVNKDKDWMPEFQVGLTLENNVILTSFNP
jgi:hypothetical protein